jgi:hypothetical protein
MAAEDRRQSGRRLFVDGGERVQITLEQAESADRDAGGVPPGPPDWAPVS